MRRSTFLIFINAMILIVVFALLTQSLFIVKRLASADVVKGNVLVQRNGKGDFRALAKNDFIKTDDVIKTGHDGEAEFKWADGTRLKITPGSELTVKKATYNVAKKADESQFRLSNGTILVRIMKALAPQSKFEVETPTAVAAVRGTIFMVSVKNGKTQVAVHKGAVKVSSGQGESEAESTINPGQVAVSQSAGTVHTTKDCALDAQFEKHDSIIKPELWVTTQELKDTNKVLLKGRTEAGDKVTVNGEPVKVLGNGAFIYRVSLKKGDNTFDVVSRDKHDEVNRVTKTITVP